TMARQFYFDHAHLLSLHALMASADDRIAAIAAKAVKEVTYHVQRSAQWVIALGDGTAESHTRMQRALEFLWPYTGELFMQHEADRVLLDANLVPNLPMLRAPWLSAIEAVLAEATLSRPQSEWMQGSHGRGGRQGVHTEHLGHLLAQMQHLQRAHPGARW
ncbi:MAG: 1,2-phenylacetyl-CoA epoxidase subunit PaaC, partial [Casimicrobiaceae bacterium]